MVLLLQRLPHWLATSSFTHVTTKIGSDCPNAATATAQTPSGLTLPAKNAHRLQQAKPKPEDLDIHIERHSDYDGLAGAPTVPTISKRRATCYVPLLPFQPEHAQEAAAPVQQQLPRSCCMCCAVHAFADIQLPMPPIIPCHAHSPARLPACAVGWGIGNTKTSVEECAEACRQHVPKGDCEWDNRRVKTIRLAWLGWLRA